MAMAGIWMGRMAASGGGDGVEGGGVGWGGGREREREREPRCRGCDLRHSGPRMVLNASLLPLVILANNREILEMSKGIRLWHHHLLTTDANS